MKRAFSASLWLLCGCGAATSPLVDLDAGATPPDAGRSVADAGAADAGSRPDALVFRLSFRSDVGAGESIYAQQSTSAHDGPGWLSVRTAAGATVHIVGRCDICDCPTSSGGCLTCPVCGPPPDVVRELSGAGDLIEHRWDQVVHPSGSCGPGAVCSAPPTPAPPGDYVATFCWSTEATGVGMGHTVGMSACDDVPFRLPDDDGVVEDPVCFCG